MAFSRKRLELLSTLGLVILLAGLTTTTVEALPSAKSLNVELKPGTDRSIQSLDVMYPLSRSSTSLTFGDLRGRIDDDQSIEVNLGIGHRFVAPDPLGFRDKSVLGFYGFADRLESRFDNTFLQATAGFEYFTRNSSFRVNGYYPEDKRKLTSTSQPLQATGTQIFFEELRNYERPLPGYDVELGRTLRFDGWQLYARGSYFRFHHSDVAEVEGSRYRTGVQFQGSHPSINLPDGSQLTIGTEWQTDQIRGDRTFGVVRFRIPFGSTGPEPSLDRTTAGSEPKLEDWQADRLTERVTRDVDVVTANGTNRVDTKPAVMSSSGQRLNNVGVAEGGADGEGTLIDPGDLSTAVDRAGTDGVVLVLGSGGTLETPGVVVPGGQFVHGVQSQLKLQTPGGSARKKLKFGQHTKNPTIRGTSPDPTVRFVTGSTGQRLRRLRFTGQGTAIKSNKNGDVLIRDILVDQSKSSGGGVSISGQRTGTDWTVQHVSIKGADVTIGDQVGADGSRFRMRNVRVTDGNLTIGVEAGAHGGSFESSGVTINNGDVSVGDRAGYRNGSFSLRSGRITDGHLSVGKTAGGNAGTARISGTRVDNGNLTIGEKAGHSDGQFKMNSVVIDSGSLSIADHAGTDGTFAMDTIEVRDGDLSIGQEAGHSSGSASLTNYSVSGGGLSIGHRPGHENGSFELRNGSVEGGNLFIGRAAGGNDGTFTLKGAKVTNGRLKLGHVSGRSNGLFSMSNVLIDNGNLLIGEKAGEEGTFTMDSIEVQSGDVLVDKYAAEGAGGSFTMTSVSVTDGKLFIDDQAGGRFGHSGSVLVKDVLVDRGNFTIGGSAGTSTSSFQLEDVLVSQGDLTIGRNAGRFGTFTATNLSVNDGDFIVEDYSGYDGGYFKMTQVDVNSGKINIGTNNFPYGRNGESGTHIMKDVSVTGGGLHMVDNVGAYGGEFRAENILVDGGDLSIKENAGGYSGTFVMDNATVTSGSMTLGDHPAGYYGSYDSSKTNSKAVIKNSTIADTLSLGRRAGRTESLMLLDNNEIENGDISVEPEAGIESGELRIKDNTLDSGDILIGSTTGTVTCSGNTVAGTNNCP